MHCRCDYQAYALDRFQERSLMSEMSLSSIVVPIRAAVSVMAMFDDISYFPIITKVDLHFRFLLLVRLLLYTL